MSEPQLEQPQKQIIELEYVVAFDDELKTLLQGSSDAFFIANDGYR